MWLAKMKEWWLKFVSVFTKSSESRENMTPVAIGATESSVEKPIVLQWVVGVLGVLLVIALVWGGIQQVKVWRWSRLLKDSKAQIMHLQAEKEQIKWTTTKELAEQGLKMTEQDLKKVEEKLKQVEQKKKVIEKEVGKMTPSDLLKSFQEEGF